MNLFIVIPVLNEIGNLERLFQSLRELTGQLKAEYCIHIILIDDGSSDGTGERALSLAKGMQFTLLRHPINQGPGRAFATAFKHLSAVLREEDWIITMEGDNTSRHELIVQMLVRAREGFDVVLASPYLYGGGIVNTTPLRVFLSHMANAFVKEALGIHGVMTMSSFFRLYRGRVILRLQESYGPGILERAGFESMIELLLKMINLKVTISEVAMVLDTSDRVGKSKMKILRTIAGYLRLFTLKNKWKLER